MDAVLNDHWAVEINNGKKEINIKHGASLLSGLARSGILLPSACGGNARCGACKIKVRGSLNGLTAKEEPLVTENEKNDFFRLACQVKVESPLKIEIPFEVFSTKQFTGKILLKRFLTHDICFLRIELIKPESIDFIAGQYVQLRSLPYQGREAVVRAFSIASPPSDSKHVDLIIRKVPNGICTDWIFSIVKEGDKAYFTAPYGSFRLSNTNAPIIFIAGGSGMAPIWSMLQYIREKGIQRSIRFFFGALTKRDLFLLDELFAMQKDLADFTFIPALSNETENDGWKGECGLIPDVVARVLPSCRECEAYLCGSPGMLNACIKVLTKDGMPLDRIYYDKF